MPSQIIYAGAVFIVKGWVENGRCQVLDLLEELEKQGDTDAIRLFNLIKRIADHGITHNRHHVRPLDEHIFEFKAPNTGRILFFFDRGRLIVCEHGFRGKKGDEDRFIKKQIKKVIRIREDYLDEAGENER